MLAIGCMSMAASAEQPARPLPCAAALELEQFDFWLGTWDVHSEDGRKVGVNEITKEQGGCVLVERWTSASGGTGTSMNYYDPVARQWVQNWIGAEGSVIDIRGARQDDGSMLLEGFIRYVGQDTDHAFRGRWSLLEDGRVRQHFEESANGGETWSDWFTGFYTRRTATAP
jgi:hypothetical protein